VRHYRSLIVNVVVLFLPVACSVDRSLAGLRERDAISAASTAITVEGVDLAFTAHVSRDYMPVAAGKYGIMVGAELQTVANWSQVPCSRGSTTCFPTYSPLVPAGVAIDRLYVVQDGRVWATKVREDPRPLQGDSFHVSARDGPHWERGQLVDIIARVDVPDGAPKYVGVKGQPIVPYY
jgi:hypothetical protein